MRIEQLRVDRFGHIERADFGPLGPGLTVIHGPNEAGKSTLHAFVRAMLFGFPRRGSTGWLPAYGEGHVGGRLVLRGDDDRRYVVERHNDARRGAARVTLDDGRVAGEEALSELLARVSSEIYQSIFAFGLDELQSLNSLPADAVSGRIYAAGFGAEQLPDATVRFQRQAAAVFLPRGRVQPVARLLDELEEVERELAAARTLVEGYHRLCERRDEVAAQVRRVGERITALDAFIQRAAILKRTLEAAGERLAQAEAERDATTRELDALAASARATPDLNPIQMRVQIDELREAWTHLRAALGMIAVYEATARRHRPRGPWLFIFLITGAVLPLLLGALIEQRVVIALGMASAALGAVTLLLAAVARSRYEAAQQQARLHMEITQRDAELRYLNAAAAAGVDPNRPDEEIERLETELADVQQTAGSRAALDELRQLLELRQRRVDGAASERDAAATALERDSEDWRAYALAWPGDDGDDDEPDPPDVARAAVDEQRNELLIELGRLDERLRLLETGAQDAELRQRRETLITELAGQAREWAVNVVAGALLREARRVYEQERQPAVLRAAGDAFDAMTLGAYHRLAVDWEAGDGIVALSRDGRRVEAGAMSRGTREQAYLALRIGLIREFGERVKPLPLLIDDVLVNFDPERAGEAMRVLARLGQRHQVLLLTCHPSTVAVARFVNPAVRVISLGDHHAPAVDPLRITND
jgi:uncharacterized protein YhaN